MKKFYKVLMVLLVTVMIPFSVNADSGFDASYSNESPDVVSSVLSLGSPVMQFMSAQPKDEDYVSYHMIVSIICIILFYVFTNIYVFKLNTKPKRKWAILGINIIPAAILSGFCFLTELQLFIYLALVGLYILIFKITTSCILKKRLKNEIEYAKSVDKAFNEEEIAKKTFTIYKDLQIAWMNMDLNDVKTVISKDILNKYKVLLAELKKDGQKNIMENIDFKSNKITGVKFDNNTEIIECSMTVTCNDYVVDNNDKVVKGKKDKKHEYTYKLVFTKELGTNKYVLIEKKMTKQK